MVMTVFTCYGVARRDGCASGLLARTLASSASVDFPTVTDICQLVHDDPKQTVAVAEVLCSAMREGNDMTKQLKAATIAHELLYDSCASRAMFETPGLLQALLCCAEPDQQKIAGALLSSPSTLHALTTTGRGRQVVMTLMKVPAGVSLQAVSQLDCVSLTSPIPKHAREMLLALREHCSGT